MPRIARIIVPGYPHHVVQRGTDGIRIFNNDGDCNFFLKQLKEWLAKTSVKIWAYCLMINHFHLLLVPPSKDSLGKCLHGLTFVFAQYFNSTYNRKGRLWQNRYFSCPVDFGNHLWTVSRYIERNPARAKLVAKPNDWKWSSAQFQTQGIKNIFESTLSEWLEKKDRREYCNFLMGEGGEKEVRNTTSTGRPFGDIEFVKKLENLLGRKLFPRKAGRPKKEILQNNMGVVPSFL